MDDIQKDYYDSYRLNWKHGQVRLEDMNSLTWAFRYNESNWNLLQEIIHKYQLHEFSFAIKWLTRYVR